MRLAILDDYMNDAVDLTDWSVLNTTHDVDHTASNDAIDITVFNQPFENEDAVANALSDFSIIVAMRERTPFPASLLARLPSLKLIVTTGMRNLSIDMQAARERDIDVCGTGMTTYAAAEHSWALVMGLAKQLTVADRTVREGGWQAAWSLPLNGKTIGILGLGKLGSQVAGYANAFGMRVIAWSENLTDERANECHATLVDKQTLLRESDYVVIQLVLSDRTRGLIGADELSLMKASAFLVNTSRGPIVDETALIKALTEKQIAGAGVDVFDVEPLPLDHAFRSLDNLLITGHTGYMVKDGIAKAYSEAVDDILQWRDGTPVRLLNA